MRLSRARELVATAATRAVGLLRLEPRVEKLDQDLSLELDALRSRIDLGEELPAQFELDRASPSYQECYQKQAPLVTVCIGTYNRAELVVKRAIRSVLAQDYRNLEVLVVGDRCTDDTEQRVASIRDTRLRFTNLPARGSYPTNPDWRWMVAGTVPFNFALEHASGDFITHLDDDDEHLPNRVSLLLDRIRSTRADLVWHPFWNEIRPDKWTLMPAARFQRRSVTTSSIFYHRWFSRIQWDINAYRYGEPGDWNRLRKLVYLGAHMTREPTPLLRHYRQRNQ